MNAVVKTIEEGIRSERTAHVGRPAPPDPERGAGGGTAEPPKLRRDMRLICDAFRISEQTRRALRSFDAATLEDFCLMTDEDFADMVVSRARVDRPIPPLQQRKLRVLLSWARSLPAPTDGGAGTRAPPSDGAGPRTGGGGDPSLVPADWERRFRDDLPRLRTELRGMGRKRSASNWATEFLCLRWVFCG